MTWSVVFFVYCQIVWHQLVKGKWCFPSTIWQLLHISPIAYVDFSACLYDQPLSISLSLLKFNFQFLFIFLVALYEWPRSGELSDTRWSRIRLHGMGIYKTTRGAVTLNLIKDKWGCLFVNYYAIRFYSWEYLITQNVLVGLFLSFTPAATVTTPIQLIVAFWLLYAIVN